MSSVDIENELLMRDRRDWRLSLGKPTAYRVGGGAVRIRTQFVVALVFGVVVLLFLHFSGGDEKGGAPAPYNATYPLTSAVVRDGVFTYRIAIVADLDTDSRLSEGKSWKSHLKRGRLSYSPSTGAVSVVWDSVPPVTLTSGYSLSGRGMELSELVVYDGRLLTFDDRSGMVFEIFHDAVRPWIILVDGDGRSHKGFKSEWATVKGTELHVGSMGKEWTTAGGEFQSYDPMWVKVVDSHGRVRHENWAARYKKLRAAVGIEWPGYMIHESGAWSEVAGRWAFLPRRCSREPYNETIDETKGCNYLITADDDFSDVRVTKVGEPSPTLGYSSFKFVPGTEDRVVVALRTTEYLGKTSTYVTAFRTDGQVLMKETFVADLKYEGLEFV